MCPHYIWDDAAARFLVETIHKRTHEWDKSMLRWAHPFPGEKEVVDINLAVLRKACNEWEWLDRVP